MPDIHEQSSWKRTPSLAKALILIQTAIILFFSQWLYQEYIYNQYFHSYLGTALQGAGLPLLVLAASAVLASTTVALFLRLRKTRRALRFSSENRPETQRALGLIDNRTEAHLIDMIRRSSPVHETLKDSAMPVLRQRPEQDTKTPSQS